MAASEAQRKEGLLSGELNEGSSTEAVVMHRDL